MSNLQELMVGTTKVVALKDGELTLPKEILLNVDENTTKKLSDENNQLTTLGEYYASQNPNNYLSNYNQKLDELTIYPNPTKNLIFINKYFSDLTASIFDLNGEIMLKEIAKSEIDLSQLKKGVYFIKLSNRKHKSVHKLIVKK